MASISQSSKDSSRSIPVGLGMFSLKYLFKKSSREETIKESYVREKLEKCDKIRPNMTAEEKKQLIERCINSDEMLKKDLQSGKFNVHEFIQYLEKSLEDFTNSPPVTDDTAGLMIESFADIVNRAPSLTIGLFITALGQNHRHVQKPLVCEGAAALTRYGLVHTGLLINDVPVHWNSDSLVTFSDDPEYCLAYVTLHVETCSMKQSSIEELKKQIDRKKDDKSLREIVDSGYRIAKKTLEKHVERCHEILRKVADRCVFFNTIRTYDVLLTNCQGFVDDIVKNLKIPFKPEDEFKIFLKNIRQNKWKLGEFTFKDQRFRNRNEFDVYVNDHWESETSQSNKKLLIQYSQLMNKMYLESDEQNQTWGPMDEQLWTDREEAVFLLKH